jgi:hypothetical protein
LNHLHWLIRMRRWVANPPSMGQVKLVVGIVVVCLAIAMFEKIFGWPEVLTLPQR